MKRLLAIFGAITLFFFPFPIPAYAQGKDWGSCVKDGVASLQCLPVVFGNIVAAAMAFVGTVAVFLFVYGCIRLVTSGGDPKQIKGAQKILTYAIIGLVVVLSSFAIIYFISYTTGVQCITIVGFNC